MSHVLHSQNFNEVLEHCKRTLTYAIATLQRSLEPPSPDAGMDGNNADNNKQRRNKGEPVKPSKSKGQVKGQGKEGDPATPSIHRNRVNSIGCIISKLEIKFVLFILAFSFHFIDVK